MGDKASELVDTRFHKGFFVSQTWKKMKQSSSSPFEQRCAAFRATCKTDNKHSNFERSGAEGKKGADCFVLWNTHLRSLYSKNPLLH